MANATTEKDNSIVITGLDADWSSRDSATFDRLKIRSITFYPSAANDRMLIGDRMDDGGLIYDSGLAANTAAIHEYFWPAKWCEPYIDISDCTLNTAANAKVIIKYM